MVTAPDKAPLDEFGRSVSLFENILAVGAGFADPANVPNAGATYLYLLETNGSATFLTKLTAPDKAPLDEFGRSISLSGNFSA